MLPEWLKIADHYDPIRDANPFIVQTIRTIGMSMSGIQIQKGHEKGRTLPPLLKLFLVTGGILLISLTQKRLVILATAACILGYLCTWPAKDIWHILKNGFKAAFLSLLILFPAMVIKRSLIANEIRIILKVFLSIICLSIFNHTTQWNHITGSLRKLHVPGIVIFILDITLKYIVLSGKLITDLLTSLELRSVGKNNKKYTSIGGIMGVTLVRSVQMNKEMVEAMQCRCFTDDYEGS